MSKRPLSPNNDEGSVRKIAKLSHSGKKKSLRFTVDLDIMLLKLIIENNPYGAPHGTMEAAWSEIAIKFNESLTIQNREAVASSRTVRERAATLLNKYRRGDPRVYADENTQPTEYQRLVQQLNILRGVQKKSESDWKVDLCSKTIPLHNSVPMINLNQSSSKKMNIENLLGELSPVSSPTDSVDSFQDSTTRQQFEEIHHQSIPVGPAFHETVENKSSIDKLIDWLTEYQVEQRRLNDTLAQLITVLHMDIKLRTEELEQRKRELSHWKSTT